MKYRIPMIFLSYSKKLNKKKGPSKDAWITLRRGHKIIIGDRGRERTGGKGGGRLEWGSMIMDRKLPEKEPEDKRKSGNLYLPWIW